MGSGLAGLVSRAGQSRLAAVFVGHIEWQFGQQWKRLLDTGLALT